MRGVATIKKIRATDDAGNSPWLLEEKLFNQAHNISSERELERLVAAYHGVFTRYNSKALYYLSF